MPGDPPTSRLPCLIAGAGLTGLWLGGALAAQGIPVEIWEKNPTIMGDPNLPATPDPRRLVLSYGSCAILQAWGIWDRIAPHGLPFHTVLVSRPGQWGRLRLTAAEAHLPFLGISIPMDALQRTAWEWLTENGGVIYPQHQVTHVTHHRDQVVIHSRSPEGITHARAADWLFWADGAPLVPPRAPHDPCSSNHPTEPPVQINVWHMSQPAGCRTGWDPHTVMQRIGRGRIWGWVPSSSHQGVLIATSIDPTIPTWETIQADWKGVLIWGDTPPPPPHRFTIHPHHAPVWQQGRTIRLGQAAHVLPPVAAQGFNLTLRDIAALIAAWPIQDWAAYVAQRQADCAHTQRFQRLLSASAHPGWGPLTGWGLGLLDSIPGLRASLIHLGIGLPDHPLDPAIGGSATSG